MQISGKYLPIIFAFSIAMPSPVICEVGAEIGWFRHDFFSFPVKGFLVERGSSLSYPLSSAGKLKIIFYHASVQYLPPLRDFLIYLTP